MFKNLLKSEFSKNVFTLLTGSTIAQIIPFLLMPVISRLFSPEEFGLFAFYFSLISFFVVIATGRYELAILMPKKDSEGMNLVALSFGILISLCLVLLLIITTFHSQIAQVMNKPELNDWLLYLPLCVFLASSYEILTYWSNRKKRFGKTSRSVIMQASSRSGLLLYFGLIRNQFTGGFQNLVEFIKSLFSKNYSVPKGATSFGVGGFIVGYMAGFGVSFLFLLANLLTHDRELLKEIKKKKMAELAKKYDKFPKINSLHAMTDEFKSSGVVFIISYAFSDIVLGFYNMTYRILRAPLGIIGKSFGQVFLQQSATMYANNQNFVPLISKIVKRLAIIASPIFVIILLFGPQLFGFVLGDEWRISGEYAQYLTPWLFVMFTSGAMVLLVMTEIQSTMNSMIYLMIFGIGSVVGMLVAAGIFSLPFSKKITENQSLQLGLVVLSSLPLFPNEEKEIQRSAINMYRSPLFFTIIFNK
mgnify:CR=1 FL=1